MKSLGLDLSTNATGLVVLEPSETKIPVLIEERTLKPTPELIGFDKYRETAGIVMETIHHHKPDRIVVEGYSLNTKNTSSLVPLVEIGGLIRFLMNIDELQWLDPRASELKKFVTGKGNTPKSHMMMHVLKRWGHQSKDDNTADAYGCACIGLLHAGKLAGSTLDQRSIVGALKLRRA